MEPGGRLVEHVHDTEQVGVDLGREAQALELARRKRRRTAFEREIAEPELEQHREPLDHILGHALRDHVALVLRGGLRGERLQQGLEPLERNARHLGDVEPRELDRERRAVEPLAVALGTRGAQHVLRDPPLHHRALRARERVHHVAARAREGAHVTGLFLALERALGLRRREARVDRHLRLLLGEQDPIALLLRQLAPRHIDVVAERDQDIAQVLAAPRHRPGRDRLLANRQRRIGNHRALRHLEQLARTLALRARALRRVRRERLGVQDALPLRVRARPRVQHPQQVRERGHAADRAARRRRAALLLERDRGRQALDRIDLGCRLLVEQAPSVGRYRFEVPALGLGVQRRERKRRFARARHAGEHDE